MKNKKAAMLTIFAGALFPVACLGQTPQVVHPAGTKPNPNSIKHAVKTNEAKTDLAPKSGTLARLRPMDPEVSQALGDSFNFSRAGDKARGLGNWAEANDDYHDALSIIPTNQQALSGIAVCAEQAGDVLNAIRYYRQDIYSHDSRYGTVPGDGFQDNDINHLMHFALLLNRTGQTDEAVFIYNRAASLTNYQDGDRQKSNQNVNVLLPELTADLEDAHQVRYTPQRLTALADTALSYAETSFGSNKEALVHMQEAVKLYPSSPVVQYYLGEALAGSYYHTSQHPAQDKVDMTVAYKKAITLGDDQTIAAAKERLSMYP